MSRTIFGYKALKNRWSVFCVLNESILKNREHKYKSTCLLSQNFKMAGQRKTYVAVNVATNLDIDTDLLAYATSMSHPATICLIQN